MERVKAQEIGLGQVRGGRREAREGFTSHGGLKSEGSCIKSLVLKPHSIYLKRRKDRNGRIRGNGR